MEINAGMLIIGSLIWDLESNRITWRKQLDLARETSILLPICYGRKSEGEGRHGTFTMVFSNNLGAHRKLGKGLVVAFNKPFLNPREFEDAMQQVAIAEGIDSARIFKGWGTVCIAINPYVDAAKRDYISGLWNNLVATTRVGLSRNQRQPNLSEYAITNEQTSIDPNLYLNIDLTDSFKSELKNFDLVAATSNAIRLNANGDIGYPTVKQIARSILDSGYYDYFLMNRKNNITTHQDKKIMRTFKQV